MKDKKLKIERQNDDTVTEEDYQFFFFDNCGFDYFHKCFRHNVDHYSGRFKHGNNCLFKKLYYKLFYNFETS